MVEVKGIEPEKWDGPPQLCLPRKQMAHLDFLDYEKLNAVTERESYLILRIRECVESLGNALIFSTLDANCTYW